MFYLSWLVGQYAFLKLSFWILFSFFIVRRADTDIVLSSFVFVGFFESILGFLQFSYTTSFSFFESLLTPFTQNVAHVYLDPGLLLRGYGTFPHPTIFAAFLTLSIFSSLYFFLHARRGWLSLIVWTTILFTLSLGFIISFSRMAWIILIVLLIYFFFIVSKKHCVSRLVLIRAGMIMSSIFFVLFVLFSWAIIPRVLGLTFNTFTVQNRIQDYDRGILLFFQSPLLGHGLSLQMGDIPIHNVYLQMITEVGLVGFLLFLFFIYTLIHRSCSNDRDVLVRCLCISFLLYGLSDHFWWTLRPGVGFFWIIIGLLWKRDVYFFRQMIKK